MAQEKEQTKLKASTKREIKIRVKTGGSRGQEIETILVNMVKPCLY